MKEVPDEGQSETQPTMEARDSIPSELEEVQRVTPHGYTTLTSLYRCTGS